MEVSSAEIDSNEIQVHIENLVTHLEFKNKPKGLAAAYQKAKGAGVTSTERVFLDTGGFSAWFAYHLTKRAAKSTTTHFEGQATCSKLLDALDEFTVESRQLIAREVLTFLSDETRTKFQDVANKMIESNQCDLAITPQKRRRTTDETDVPLPTPTPNPAASANNDEMSTVACQSSTRFSLGNPPVLRATAVFPTFLAGAISRRHLQDGSEVGGSWVAAITLSFLDASSFGNKLGAMMSLEITSNKVERIASQLFDAHIESTDENRYVVLPTGLRIIPSPDLILRGCDRDVILEVFGHDTDRAVRASPAFREEAEQGNPRTECITMTISHRAKDGAVINLTLDEKEGVRLRRTLYE